MDGPCGGELVGGAGVPADPDAHLVGPLLGEQGDWAAPRFPDR